MLAFTSKIDSFNRCSSKFSTSIIQRWHSLECLLLAPTFYCLICRYVFVQLRLKSERDFLIDEWNSRFRVASATNTIVSLKVYLGMCAHCARSVTANHVFYGQTDNSIHISMRDASQLFCFLESIVLSVFEKIRAIFFYFSRFILHFYDYFSIFL